MQVIYRLSAVMLFAAGLYGQQGGDAVVVGTVLDSSQAAVQSARVTLTHLATGAVIQVLHRRARRLSHSSAAHRRIHHRHRSRRVQAL